jgi:PBP1b-binding outer membrane lipoprotein LpoB
MTKHFSIVVLVAVAVAVSGCSAVRKFTKKNDNTVLPGERSEILSPEQYKVDDATVSGGQQADQAAPEKACDPATDANCSDAIDQEAGDPAG